MGQVATHWEVSHMNLSKQETCPVSDYRTIPLTQGQVAIVDAADYERVNAFQWCAWKNRRKFYAKRGVTVSGKSICVYMHRFVLSTPDGMTTDHVNGNTLDNRRCNLRICTHAENLQNRGKTRRNSSGYKGVYYFKRDSNWQAQIKSNGQKYHIGYFDSPSEAARAYDAAAVKLHGEFAALNFPKERENGTGL